MHAMKTEWAFMSPWRIDVAQQPYSIAEELERERSACTCRMLPATLLPTSTDVVTIPLKCRTKGRLDWGNKKKANPHQKKHKQRTKTFDFVQREWPWVTHRWPIMRMRNISSGERHALTKPSKCDAFMSSGSHRHRKSSWKVMNKVLSTKKAKCFSSEKCQQ